MKIKKISILTFAIALTSFFGMAQETQSKKKKNYQYEKTDKEWQSFLPKMSYLVLRKAATSKVN